MAKSWLLCHNQRSNQQFSEKMVAYVIVGSCILLRYVLWVVLLALLPVFTSQVPLTAVDWRNFGETTRELLLLCGGMGLAGFFLTRKTLLAYADWKRVPWYVAYAGGNGYLYCPEDHTHKR